MKLLLITVSNISSSLPLLPLSEEAQGHPTEASNQIHTHTEEHRLFTQSEINDDD